MLDRVGKYRLISLLASGGMGEVFLAKMEGPAGFARTVVIKRILPHLSRDPTFVQMFLDEARVAAQLVHPNIVQVIELGEHEGNYFIAMEYVHGLSARAMRQAASGRGAVLPPQVVARILSQALQGLHYAHTAVNDEGRPLDVIHRDVSPDNIMVAYSGTVKVLDFGIAKAADAATTTRTGTVKGKYGYMSPEQLLAEKIDPRADLYAAGVVAYELLAGHRPYTAPSEAALVRKILDTPLPPLVEAAPHVPEDLAAIVTLALEKDGEKRYTTAEAFAVALETWLAEQPHEPSLLLPAFMRAHHTTASGEFPAVVTPSAGRPAATLVPTVPERGTPSRQEPSRTMPWLTVLGAAVLVVGLGLGALVALTPVPEGPKGEPPQPRLAQAPDASPAPPPAAEEEPLDAGPEAPGADEHTAQAPAAPEAHDAGAAAARPHPVKGGKGRLDLRVNPWGEVFEGGVSLGITPFAPLELPAGRHTLTVKNDKLSVNRTVKVTVTSGKTTLVRVDLLE